MDPSPMAEAAFFHHLEALANPETLAAMVAVLAVMRLDPAAEQSFEHAQEEEMGALMRSGPSPLEEPQAHLAHLLDGAQEALLRALAAASDHATLPETKVACTKLTTLLLADPDFARHLMESCEIAYSIEKAPPSRALYVEPDEGLPPLPGVCSPREGEA